MTRRRLGLGLIVAALLFAGAQAKPVAAQHLIIRIDPSQNSNFVPGMNLLDLLTGFVQIVNVNKAPGTAAPKSSVAPILSAIGDKIGHAMSCPVFVGPGTLLGEDTCAWAKVTGDAASQGSATTHGIGWHVGGQFEVGPGWFLGGSAGTGASSVQTPYGLSKTARSFDAAVVVKRIDGPLLLAGAIGVGTSTDQNSWSVAGPGGGTAVMNSSMTTVNGGLMVRGAYQFAMDPVYLRPRLDVGLGLMTWSGLQESGPAVGVTIDPGSKLALQIKPALEVGGRLDIGAVILRPYAAAGPAFVPDSSLTLGGSAGGRPVSGTLYGTNVMFSGEAGLQVYEAKSWDMRLEYRLTAADAFLDQSVGLRGAKHF